MARGPQHISMTYSPKDIQLEAYIDMHLEDPYCSPAGSYIIIVLPDYFFPLERMIKEKLIKLYLNAGWTKVGFYDNEFRVERFGDLGYIHSGYWNKDKQERKCPECCSEDIQYLPKSDNWECFTCLYTWMEKE